MSAGRGRALAFELSKVRLARNGASYEAARTLQNIRSFETLLAFLRFPFCRFHFESLSPSLFAKSEYQSESKLWKLYKARLPLKLIYSLSFII